MEVGGGGGATPEDDPSRNYFPCKFCGKVLGTQRARWGHIGRCQFKPRVGPGVADSDPLPMAKRPKPAPRGSSGVVSGGGGGGGGRTVSSSSAAAAAAATDYPFATTLPNPDFATGVCGGLPVDKLSDKEAMEFPQEQHTCYLRVRNHIVSLLCFRRYVCVCVSVSVCVCICHHLYSLRAQPQLFASM